jgi:hypothetical protein
MVKLYVDGIFACLKTNPNVNNAEQFLALNRSSRFTLINNMLEQLSKINNKKSLNELLLEGGCAVIYQDFCDISEFASANWAQSRVC